MLDLQIDNYEIELAFKSRFNANKDKLIAFIESSFKIPEALKNGEFIFNRLDPLNNYYKFEKSEYNDSLLNPFVNINNTIEFSKKIRESSYRSREL